MGVLIEEIAWFLGVAVLVWLGGKLGGGLSVLWMWEYEKFFVVIRCF
jgi:hypothetical protein